jgi:hypothetical protein
MNSGRAVTKKFPLSVQADDIRAELNCWGDDVPIKGVYLASEPVKQQMIQGGPPPDALVGIAKLYWSAKYIYVGGKLGADPQAEARWAAPDESGADAVIKELDNTRQLMKKSTGDLGGLAFLTPILDQAHPVRNGSDVLVSLNQKDLSNIFSGILIASMAQQRNNGQASATQTPVAADWAPMDPATDAAASQMRLILSAIAEYDHENNALPATLDDLAKAKLIPGPEIFHDPRTNTDNGFVYVQPQGVTKLSDVATPGKTAILFEQKNGQPDQDGLIGYANGNVKIPK